MIIYKAMPFDQTPQRAHSVHVGDEIAVGYRYRFRYMVSICIQMTGMYVLVFLKSIVGKIGSTSCTGGL